MADNNYIPTPLWLRWRVVRYQLMPILTMLICSTLAGWLWMRHGGSAATTGAVNVVRVGVNSRTDGVLVSLPRQQVELFQEVKAGDLVARLDRGAYDAQIDRLTQQIALLQSELTRIEKGARSPTTAPIIEDLTTDPADLDAADPASGLQFVPHTLSAIRQAISAHEAKIKELEQKILHLDVKAPIGGMIVELQRRPGQAVQAGQTILTIASADGQFIVAYVRQDQVVQPTRNMSVDIRVRSTPPRLLRTDVATIGPQFEPIPAEQAINPKVAEWGLPVHIRIPKEARLRPGELVDVFFRPDAG